MTQREFLNKVIATPNIAEDVKQKARNPYRKARHQERAEKR